MELLDASVDVESSFYDAGLSEGSAAGAREGRVQGRIYGTEVAYERMLQLGMMAAYLDLWQAQAQAQATVQATATATATATIDAPAMAPVAAQEQERVQEQAQTQGPAADVGRRARADRAFLKAREALAAVPLHNGTVGESEVDFEQAIDAARLQFRFLARALGVQQPVEELLDHGMPDVARFKGVGDVEDATGPLSSF